MKAHSETHFENENKVLEKFSKKLDAVQLLEYCQGERRESLKEEMLFGRVYKCKVC